MRELFCNVVGRLCRIFGCLLQLLPSIVLFPLPVLCIWSYLNTVAIVMDTTMALPFGTGARLIAEFGLDSPSPRKPTT